jgi:hypothetical protein
MLVLFLIVALRIMLLVIFAPPTKRSTYSFRCPFKGREVTAEFDEEVWAHRRVSVVSCSALTGSARPACPLTCLGLTVLPPPRRPLADGS